MQNNIVLFDIDYTLFNVGKYRELVFKKLATYFPEISNFSEVATKTYNEIRQTGWFEIPTFTKKLLSYYSTTVDTKTLENVWRDHALLEKALYPEAVDVLTKLSNMNLTLGLFSSGNLDFQKSKIAKFAHFFKEEHMHILTLKDEKLPEIIKKYQKKKIILIDDYIPVIEKAKKLDPAIIAIWIKRGTLSEKFPPSESYPPDYTLESLTQLPEIIMSLI